MKEKGEDFAIERAEVDHLYLVVCRNEKWQGVLSITERRHQHRCKAEKKKKKGTLACSTAPFFSIFIFPLSSYHKAK